MITDNHRKETLSIAYVQSLAGKAGLIIECGKGSFDYGVDGRFSLVKIYENSDERFESGLPLLFQLKSSSNYAMKQDFVSFTMKTNAYNKIIERNNSISQKLILIAFCMPKNEDEWLDVTEERLVIKNACYWYEILDKDKKPEDSTIALKIPRTNLFTPAKLKELMDKVQKGEILI